MQAATEIDPSCLDDDHYHHHHQQQQQQQQHPASSSTEVANNVAEATTGLQQLIYGPPWLEPLLSTHFFHPCNTHASETSKAECNQFCLQCIGSPAFCPSCLPSRHRQHPVIQIRRSSYHDVIRVAEIQKSIDLSGIQTYIINSARVVFIRGRPQPRQGKGVTNNCHICGRSLVDAFRFCSLACKLEGIKKHQASTFFLAPKSSKTEDHNKSKNQLLSAKSHSTCIIYDTKNDGNSLQTQGLYNFQGPVPLTTRNSSPALTTNKNTKRRKGIPQRAPMGLCYQYS